NKSKSSTPSWKLFSCTDRSPIELTRSVRARFGGNPHPAARSENDWKFAPSSTERKCSSSGSLKHAFEPSLFEPKSPLPGNEIFRPETNGPKRRRSSRRGDRETKPTRRTPRFGANRRVR